MLFVLPTEGRASPMAHELPKYDIEHVRLVDQIRAIAESLNGASEALFYRAEAESDDMLHLIAEIVRAQAEALREL